MKIRNKTTGTFMPGLSHTDGQISYPDNYQWDEENRSIVDTRGIVIMGGLGSDWEPVRDDGKPVQQHVEVSQRIADIEARLSGVEQKGDDGKV